MEDKKGDDERESSGHKPSDNPEHISSGIPKEVYEELNKRRGKYVDPQVLDESEPDSQTDEVDDSPDSVQDSDS